jgi:hypothetical protein
MAATKGETKFESRNPKLCQKRGQTLSGHTVFPESSACPPKGQTPFLTEPKQIQNRKFECPKQTAKHAPLARHPRIPDKTVGRPRFEHLVFDIWICFGFRASDFEFQTCAHRTHILRLKTLQGPPFTIPPHDSGRWKKKIRGCLHYSGPWGRKRGDRIIYVQDIINGGLGNTDVSPCGWKRWLRYAWQSSCGHAPHGATEYIACAMSFFSVISVISVISVPL